VRHRVGTVEELRRDRCRIIDVGGRPVGVISVGEAFYAFHDRCPHMGPSLCHGTVSGTFLAAAPHELVYGKHDGVIRCPWHGWEFDLATGRSLLEPDRVGLKTYEVSVEDGEVFLS
jgi:nitrite reductase/ring-hydroxylating ferredoxin subunit